jgi:hypothetical protein
VRFQAAKAGKQQGRNAERVAFAVNLDMGADERSIVGGIGPGFG